MDLKKLMRSKRYIWHKHFIPSIFAGLLVALISFLYKGTISNIILFASVGASAIILTNSKSHHLTKLNTVIFAYMVTIIFSIGLYLTNSLIYIPIHINLFILISALSLLLYLFNIFHPPAITASISFILLQKPLTDLVWLFMAIIILLIIWRFIVYTLIQNFSGKEFKKQWKKGFRKRFK